MLLNPLARGVVERHGFPIAPGAFPLVGHIPVNMTDGLGFHRRNCDRFGPFFWVDAGFGLHELMCTGTEGFAIFKNKTTTSTYLKEFLPEIFGESMIAQDGKIHHHMRTAMNGPMLPRGLTTGGVGELFAQHIDRRLSTWPLDGELRILHATRELVLGLMFRMLGVDETEVAAWREHYEQLMLLSIRLPIDVPGAPHRRGRQAKAWLDERLRNVIRAARQLGATGFLAALVNSRDEDGVEMSEAHLIDNLRLLLLAGHETSATTMAWIVIMMARHPAVWDAVCDEACAAADVPRSPKDLKGFPYAEAVFREALRLHPPVWTDSRQSTAEFEMAGRRIPAGVRLSTSIISLSRDPSMYPDPDAFKPERWLGKGEALTALELAQFGGGPHFCMGYHLAWMEIVLFVVTLARMMRPRDLRPHLVGPPPVMRYLPLLHPAAATRVAFTRAASRARGLRSVVERLTPFGRAASR
jgi:cytochrome P450